MILIRRRNLQNKLKDHKHYVKEEEEEEVVKIICLFIYVCIFVYAYFCSDKEERSQSKECQLGSHEVSEGKSRELLGVI